MIIFCGVLALTGIVTTLALCKAAGRADNWIEEMYERKKDEEVKIKSNE